MTYKTPRIKGVDFAKDIHFAVPKILFINEEYVELSPEAKLMYSIFLDRAKLSSIRGFENKDGEPYIFYSVESLQKLFGCSDRKITKLKKELLNHGLIDIEVTGRAHRMYIHHLSYTGYTASDLEEFEAPIENETKWTPSERLLLSKNNGRKHQNKKANISRSLSEFHNEPKKLRVIVERGENNVPDSQDGQRPENYSPQRRTKSGSSKSNIVIDNTLDNILDHPIDDYKKNKTDELSKMEMDLFWYDLEQSNTYHTQIIVTLKALSNSEDVRMVQRVLRKVMQDIMKGKIPQDSAYKPYEENIQDTLDEIDCYLNPNLAEAVRFTIIRAFKMSEKEVINNKEAYYYKAILSTILQFLANHYSIQEGVEEIDDIEIPLL